MHKILQKFRWLLLFVCVVAGVFRYDVYAQQPEKSFWVEYIDVGQGDCALIQCDGYYMMIDGGPSSASQIVYSVLKNNNIKSLEYIIATHPDADHIGGLSGALNAAKVGVCYSPVTTHDTKTFNSMVKYLNKQGVALSVPKQRTNFSLGSAMVDIVGPVYYSSDSNNNSIVTKITYGNNTFLFTGDAEIEEEDDIMRSGVSLLCDVLKVGHHGSNSSTSNDFLRAVKPTYAVISVGKDNSYGHPTSTILGRLQNANVTVYRTDVQGDIICESDGKNITFKTGRNAKSDSLWVGGDKVNEPQVSYTNEANTSVSSDVAGSSYVLNTRSKKFHYPTCSSVDEMSLKNRQDVTMYRDEIIALGFEPCKRCKP